ncbi:gamma carbonic anhydrase family protein [Tistrella mobilis]|uniref:gamma carbonic anhydrase family protein n=1 Tax=Tistrella mobilis TaxID=171437 RepID=UPI0035582DD4
MPLYALDDLEPEIADPARIWIAPDAHVIGRVRLGLDVGIWFGAVLRGDNDLIAVGDRTNVQDGATLHTDRGVPLTIGTGVTIGHHAMIHGCTIGDNALIGIGATILNGARIGANCLVGAHALVTEGKDFPEGSLILGSPAKAVRPLDAAALAMLKGSAEGYVRNAARFRTGLRVVG